jgi:hypothetical protein
VAVHAVLLAGGTPGSEPPAEIPSFPEGLDRHWNKMGTSQKMSTLALRRKLLVTIFLGVSAGSDLATTGCAIGTYENMDSAHIVRRIYAT